MPVIVSGTAGTRLSRVQRTLPSVTTFEAGILTYEESDAVLNPTVYTEEGKNTSNGSISSFQHRNEANEPNSLGPPDPLALVLLSPHDLCACGLFNSDVIQVSNATRPDVPAHLATVQALHYREGAGRSQNSSPPCAKALLTPFLAYNLGLEYHAVPFYPKASHEGECSPHTAHRLGAPAEQPSCGTVRLSRWRGSSGNVPSPAKLPVADAVWVSSVRQPDASLLRAQQGTEHCAAEAAAQDLPNGSGTHQQRQQQGHGQADDNPDTALVAALQSYFKQHPRLLAQGDVFAVSMADTVGTAKVLVSLLRDTAISTATPNTLVYFRVDKMLPASNSSLLVDPRHSAMTMKGSCSCTIPIGLQPVPQLRAPAESTAAALAGGRAAREAACLGVSAVAAHAPAPWLPGTGVLLPAWRRLAQLLALMNHQGAEASSVCVSILIHGPSGCGKSTAVSAAAAALGLNIVPYSCHEFIGQSDAAVAAALKAALESAQEFAPAVLHLEDLSALCSAEQAQGSALGGGGGAVRLASALSQIIAEGCSVASQDGSMFRSRSPADAPDLRQGSRVTVVASTEAVEDMAAPLRRCFTHELSVEAPDKDARLSILEDLVQNSSSTTDVNLEQIASQAAGMLPSDLMAISADAASSAALQMLGPELAAMLDGKEGSEAHSQSKAPADCLRLTSEHYETGLQNLRQRTAVAIGAPQVPNVQWEDVGGLEDVKASILETVDLPLRHPHLFSQGLRRRSGVLLYGPPGTGKTLLAKAVATECQLNFLSVKGPELINMYIGESERQVREVFARARRARPCVVFFDELDSLAPARGAGADSGGVMDRVVAQLLAEIDGAQQSGEGSSAASASQDLFIIGATNRPDLLDRALMRPGRLDKLLYVGVAEDVASKAKVLRALTRKFKLAPTVDLDAVARECAPTYTGADLYALCADAWMAGLKRIIAEAEEGGTQAGGNEEVTVDLCDFWAALRELRPSLSPDELERYRAIKEQHEAQA